MIKISHHASLALVLSFGVVSSVEGAEGCRAAPPADFGKAPTRWLGDCPHGQAEGLGVMRGGAGEPFNFFLGEMRGGSPVRGMVILRDGAKIVTRFDAAHRDATPRSGDLGEYHALWAQAVRAASVTAQHFAAVGNPGSATYYRRLAKKISDHEPE